MPKRRRAPAKPQRPLQGEATNRVRHFVYALTDTYYGTIEDFFYVGRTTDLLGRFLQHVRGDNSGSKKDERVQSILAAGRLPAMHTLFVTQSEEGAEYYEEFYIEYYRARGAPLTNSILPLGSGAKAGRLSWETECAVREVYGLVDQAEEGGHA
jgi:predicted GIY-YIG superfamily endonuclease